MDLPDDPVVERRRRLGEALAAGRAAAGLNQTELARRLKYDRTTVAHAERGAQIPAAEFWQACERLLKAEGLLLRLYAEWQQAKDDKAADTAAWARAEQRVRLADRGVHESGRDAVLGVADSDALSAAEPHAIQAVGLDLWDLLEALSGRQLGRVTLTAIERSVALIDSEYAKFPPGVLFPEVRWQLRALARTLRESQPVTQRRRLCSLAGQLGGLRAWLHFDCKDHASATAWYELAMTAALQAEDHTLCGWLLGGRSLVPSYDHDPKTALAYIERGQAYVSGSSSVTVRAWLDALEARARAGLGDSSGFRQARGRANQLLERTSLAERRHGMDFRGGQLDIAYYEGSGLLQLQHPSPARTCLQEALEALPGDRAKARSIILLAIASTYVQEREIEDACRLAEDALSLPGPQCIGPILQRANDLLSELEPWRDTPSVATLRQQLLDRDG